LRYLPGGILTRYFGLGFSGRIEFQYGLLGWVRRIEG